MDPRMVYPTAPFDTHAQTPNVDVPASHTGAGENVESPGKTMAVLSKVKHKAKKLKNKLKKVRGSSKTSTDHGEHDTRDSPIFDEGAESDEDDDDEEKPNQNEFKYEQLRSIGALDSPGDGSEVEVHGGVPVPAAADNRGTYWNKSDDSDPIGPFKSAGPPDALQATPTKYRNYAAADDVLPEKGVPANRKLEVGSPPAEYGRTGKEDVSSSVPQVQASNRSYDERVEPLSKPDIPGVPSTYRDEPLSENRAERNPSFGESSTPTYDNIAVADEDLVADRKLGVGLPPGEHVGSGTGNALYTSTPEFNADEKATFLSDAERAEPTSKPDVSDVPASYSESLAEHSPAFGKSSTPTYDNIAVADEDLSADRKLGVGLSSDEHVGSGKEIPLGMSVPEYKPEEKSALLTDAQQGEPTSRHGILDSASASASASASDMDVSYPGDIVKPNPSFGKSSSPTHEKIAVMTENGSPDGMRGFGLSSEDHSSSEKGNLLDTSVPEFEELSGYRKGSSSGPLEADELVYKPLSEPEPEIGSSLASPPGKVEDIAGQSFGTEQGLDNNTRQTRDLDLPTSVVDEADSKGEHDLPMSYSEQRPEFDEATQQPADSGIDASGGDDRENWGKWSADKINKAKDVTVSGLVGTDYRPDSETRGYDPVGSAVEVPDSQNVDAAKQDAIEGESKDVEEEYYDPNEVKDNQFEEGFALGSEDALSGTLAGSAIDKLQGLKETVQSSLGYSTPENRSVRGEDKAGLEGEGGALSPSSHKQQTSGVSQGLREGVASALGYSKAVSDGTEHSEEGLEGGLESEADRGSRQQQPGLEGEESAPSPSSYKQPTGGFIQGLKQTVASSLGYGKAASDEVGDKNDTLEQGGESDGEYDSSQHQPGVEGVEKTPSLSSKEQETGNNVQGLTEVVTSYPSSGKAASDEVGHSNDVGERDGGSEADVDIMQHQPVLEGEEKALSPGSYKQQTGGFVQGLKQAVASSFGYGKAVSNEAGPEDDVLERGGGSEADFDSSQHQPDPEGKDRVLSSSSYEQQTEGDVQEPKEVVASPLGLKEAVESPLGYGEEASHEAGHNNVLERGGDDTRQYPPVIEGEEASLSPSSYKQQQTGGFVQGLKNTVASSLGYGKGMSEESGHEKDTSGRGGGSEADLDSKQQQPGTYQALKNVVASKLGYGSAENSPVITKESESRELPVEQASHEPELGYGSAEQSPVTTKESEAPEFPVEQVSHEPHYDQVGEQQHDTEGGYAQSETRDDVNREDEVSELPGSGGVLEDVKDRVIATPGYNNQPEGTSTDATHMESVPSPSSYSQKLMDTTAAARNYLSSKIGYGGSRKEKGEEDFDHGYEGEKGLNPSTHADNTVNEQSSVAPTLHPSDEDKALSDLITQKMSSTANIIGEQDGSGPGGEERALSPISYKQTDGCVQPPSEPVASSPRYVKAVSDETEHDEDGLDGGGKSEADLDARKQQSRLEGEENALSPSIYKSQTSGFVQGLKQTVASSLGYGKRASEEAGYNNDGLQQGDKLEPDFDSSSPHQPGFEGEDRVLSPSNYEQQTGGGVEGLKDSDAPPLGYGKAASDEAGNNDASERADELEGDVDSRQHPPALEGEERALSLSSNKQQQTGGFVQGLKNMVASALGYGKATSEEVGHEKDALERGDGSEAAEKLPVITKEKESYEFPVEEISQGQLYNEGGEEQHVSEEGSVLIDARDDTNREDEVSELPGSGEVLQDVKGRVILTPGSNSQPEDTSSDATHVESVASPSSYTQKLMNTTAAARNYLSSKVGYGSSSKEKGEKDLIHEHGGEEDFSPSTHDGNIESEESSIVSKLQPSDDDKAPSDLITENLSSTASRKGMEDGSGLKGEERALSSSNYKQQTDGLVQGLREPVASSPGYSKKVSDETEHDGDGLDGSGGSEADLAASNQQPGPEGEESALSPSSYKPQTGGFIQGLKQTVASSLGYGKRASDEVGYKNDGLQRGGESEADFDSSPYQPGSEGDDGVVSPSSYEQQMVGSGLGLKEAIVSPLGYDEAASHAAAGRNIDVLGRGGGSEADVATRQYQPVLEGEEKAFSTSSNKQRTGGFLRGLKQTVASSLGYDDTVASDEAGHKNDGLKRGGESEADFDSSQYQSAPEGEDRIFSPISYEQRAGGDVPGLKEADVSPLGLKETVTSPLAYSKAAEAGDDVQGLKEADVSPLGLKETVTSPLGYSKAASDEAAHNNDVSKRAGGAETDVDTKQYQPALLPSSYKQQTGGFVQGLKNTVASSLGYGKAAPKEAGHFGRGGESEPDLDSEQQQSGTNQALKNVVAPKPGEESPVITKENEPQECPVEVPREQLYDEGGEQQHDTEEGHVQSVARDVPQEQLYNEGGEQQHDTEERHVLSDATDNAQDGGSEAVLDSKQQQPGTYQALKNVFASKLGYGPADHSPVITEEKESYEFPVKEESHGQLYNEGGEQQRDTEGGYVQSDVRDKANRENEISTPGYNSSQPEDIPSNETHIESVSSPSSYTQKLLHTTAAARSFLSGKVGYGSSNKQRGEKGLDHGQEGEKNLSPSGHVDNTEYEQSGIASKLHPSNEDKALADLITEKVASTASMMGGKLRLFGSPRSSDMPASDQPQH